MYWLRGDLVSQLPRSAAPSWMRRWARWLPAVIALFIAAPLTHQPLYDGVAFPDEPYRYVVAPTGAPPAPAPVAATTQVSLARGTNAQQVVVATGEHGPQALLLLRTGTIRSGSDAVTVTLTPTALPASKPGTQLLGNVYDVTITAPDGHPATTKGQAPLVQLRVPQGAGPPVTLLRYRHGGWQPLETKRTGSDIYSAALPGLGRVVAAHDSINGRRSGSGGHPEALSFWSLLAAALGLVLVIVLIRRRPEPEPSQRSG